MYIYIKNKTSSDSIEIDNTIIYKRTILIIK